MRVYVCMGLSMCVKLHTVFGGGAVPCCPVIRRGKIVE